MAAGGVQEAGEGGVAATALGGRRETDKERWAVYTWNCGLFPFLECEGVHAPAPYMSQGPACTATF